MSNLLEKASILLTPTAYDDGKILSVKPSIVLGNELVTNGDFATDSDWTLGTGWSISNGAASCDGTQTSNSQLRSTFFNFSVDTKVTLSFDVINYSAGDLDAGVTGTGQADLTGINANGTYSVTVVSSAGSRQVDIVAKSDFIGSIDNVSVKEAIDGDFDFTRNSSATRVNSQGLIEDVQILSSNLVSNGDFSQEGAELVTNGDFATDSDWTKGAGWSIANGKAISDGVSSNSNLATTSAFYSGSTPVKMTINVTDYVSGGLKVYLSSTNFTEITANGNFTFYTTADRTDGKLYLKSINFNASIDNVSVKEVGQDWTFQSKWSIGNGFAQLISNDSTGSSLIPNTVVIIGNKYKCSFDVVINSGSCKLQGSSGTTYQTIDETKTYNFNFIADSGDIYFNRLSSVSDITITNISVIEITDDTNLPRIDYSPYSGTGTCGHWLFEPQSTNLLPYSEDFSQYAIGNYPVVNGGFLAPDGTNNAYKITNNGSSTLYLAGLTNLNSTSTRTIYAKTVSGTGTATLMSYFGNTNNLFTLTDQWQRFELNALTTLTGENNFYAVDFRGTGTLNEILIWGANATNDQDYATSYIPTSGSTVTRNQEAAFGSGNSSLINSTEGVLYAEIAALTQSPSGRRDIALSDGTSGGNIVRIHYLNTVDNTIRVQVRSGGSITASVSTAVTDIRDFHKIAISYKVNEVKFYIDGVLINTDTNAAMPIGLNQLSFSDGNGTTNKFFGKTKCVAVFKEALTDDELECLTSDETSFSSFNALALANNYTII